MATANAGTPAVIALMAAVMILAVMATLTTMASNCRCWQWWRPNDNGSGDKHDAENHHDGEQSGLVADRRAVCALRTTV